MTIASALQSLNTDIQNARAVITNKGGTVTANGGSSQLATDIATIPSGGTDNRFYTSNVSITGVATVLKDSGDITGAFNNVTSVDVDGAFQSAWYNKTGITGTVSFPLMTGVSGNKAFFQTFSGTNISGAVNLSALTTISSTATTTANAPFYETFRNCPNITSIDLSGLVTIGDLNNGHCLIYHMTRGGNSNITINLSNLTTIGKGASSSVYCMQAPFSGCEISTNPFTALQTIGDYGSLSLIPTTYKGTSISFPSLTTIGKGGFTQGVSCASNLTKYLETASFPVLTNLDQMSMGSAFLHQTKLTDVYFNALTTTSFAHANPFNNMLRDTGTAVTHTLHFPSNLETTIQGLTGYPLFGGTSGYVTLSFDLTATS